MNDEMKERIRAAAKARLHKQPTVIDWDDAIARLRNILDDLDERRRA